MICVKFGGTSVTPENLHYVADIVDNNVGPVVVSAVGREFLGDDKLTDLLDLYGKSREEIVWQAICGKVVRLCEVNGIDVDVERLLFNARQQIERHNRDYCLSVGEELTARCVAAFLGREYIEAAKYVVFSDGRFDETQTKLRLKELAGHRFVVGGFYGGTDSGERVTFQRGGGDVSGAIFAVFCDCTLYDNRTDVDGVCTADPTKVADVQVLRQISYAQMQMLSQCGAAVLHPDTLKLPSQVGIPIVVRSVFDKRSAGTNVSFCPCRLPVVSVTSRAQNNVVETVMLHNMPPDVFFAKLAQATILTRFAESINCTKNVVRLTSGYDLTNLTYKAFV